MIFLHTVLILVSILACRQAWRHSNGRLPLSLYLLSYTMTCALGAVIIGFARDYDWLERTNSGLNLAMIGPSVETTIFWILVYSPFIVVPLSMSLIVSLFRRRAVSSTLLKAVQRDINIVLFSIVSGAFLAYCCYELYTNGYLGADIFERMTTVTRDYDNVIKLRIQMSSTLHSLYYCVLYMTLPAISHVALHQWIVRRSRSWLIVNIVLVAAITFMSLLTMQKSVALIYWLSLLLGLAVHGKLRLKLLPAAGLLLAVITITSFQASLRHDWTVIDTVSLLVFRMASSLPFYTAVYPAFHAYHGLDLGQDLFGIGTMPTDNLIVFNYMYPGLTWIQGAAGAPAQVRGYAQGGILVAILTLVAVAWIVVVVGRLGTVRKYALGYAAFIQGCVCLYYLTQTSLREALLSSYGFVWALLGLAVVWCVGSVPLRFGRSRRRMAGGNARLIRATNPGRPAPVPASIGERAG